MCDLDIINCLLVVLFFFWDWDLELRIQVSQIMFIYPLHFVK